VAKVVKGCGYQGRILWDRSKPDGQPRRGLDISRARTLLDWQPIRDFDQGLAETIQWWRERSG
jgi:nucleoside-diphosphate-sugar epimerase